MPDVLVRGIKAEVLESLKRRAKANGRSLQAELKSILEQAAQACLIDSHALAAKIKRSLSKVQHSESAKLLTEDRQR
jgi:plasmid stability protein